MSSNSVANPYSTGGGGSIFEAKIYASFIVRMLIGELYEHVSLPYAPLGQIETIRLQAQGDGYRTDDCVITIKSHQKHQLLIQVKSQMTYSSRHSEFIDVVTRAWEDFNNPSAFNPKNDVIVLITGPLPQSVINHVRPLFFWAQVSSDATDFINKVNAHSKQKAGYLKEFRDVIDQANGTAVSDDKLWGFMCSFQVLGLDFESPQGSNYADTLTILQFILNHSSGESVDGLWGKIFKFAAEANALGATITSQNIPSDIRRNIRRVTDTSAPNMISMASTLKGLRHRVQQFIDDFQAPLRTDLEEMMIIVYDKLVELDDHAAVRFMNRYHVPAEDARFDDGLVDLWKLMTLYHLRHRDLP